MISTSIAHGAENFLQNIGLYNTMYENNNVQLEE